MFSRLSSRAFPLFSRGVRAFSSTVSATASRLPSFRPLVAAATVAASASLVPSLFVPADAHALTKIPQEGIAGTNSERTFIAIKPDGVQRGLVAKIIGRFEDKGFKLVALKLITPTQELASEHYSDLKTKPFFPSLVKFFSSGPIVAMVWEGKGVVKTGRVLLGETDPAKSLPGSIRGDFSIDIGRNICHGSDSTDAAKAEINFWFAENEVFSWDSAEASWIYEKPKA